jgi:hypothetical protein
MLMLMMIKTLYQDCISNLVMKTIKYKSQLLKRTPPKNRHRQYDAKNANANPAVVNASRQEFPVGVIRYKQKTKNQTRTISSKTPPYSKQ